MSGHTKKRDRSPVFVLVVIMSLLALIYIISQPPIVSVINPQPTLLAVPQVEDTTTETDTSALNSQDESLFTINLHSAILFYSSRLGNPWSTNDNIRFTYVDRSQHGTMPYGSLMSRNIGELWEYGIVLPLPPEVMVEPVHFPIAHIDIESDSYGDYQIENGIFIPIITGTNRIIIPGAVFLEISKEQYESDLQYSARCHHYVNGQITIFSMEPVVGEFQFFCQFDSTDYAQVSGRFWE